ncbi:MAG TPA: PIG-L family deacetylase [Gemmatimonadaceae bacterium]
MPRPVRLVLATVLLAAPAPPTVADAQDRGATALGEAIHGLGVNTRVLMIGAHPDDEDTQVISWLSRGRHVETAYLSLTRGDGGQNIIGNELGEALGVVRTEELLAARRVDGGKQFFTRAYDYGFSKSAEEAFAQWPHDSLLRDVLTVVRSFRPHVIISVFTGTSRDGHGQHQAAGILAREAYDWSGDTVRFPRETTKGRSEWTVSKFYRGASFRRQSGTLRMNVGEYDPLLGRSYAEIAAVSRSQHRSQAFGTLQPLGVRFDYLQREASRVRAPDSASDERSIFDGIDTTWARFGRSTVDPSSRAALDSLPAAFAAAQTSFNAFAPDRSIPALARIKALLNRVCPPPVSPACGGATDGSGDTADLTVSVLLALDRVSQALTLASGVVVEATLPRELWAVAEPLRVRPTLHNRGRRPVTVLEGFLGIDSILTRAGGSAAVTVLPDSSAVLDLFIGDGFGQRFESVTSPRWLGRPRNGAMFDYAVIGADEAYYASGPWVALRLAVDGVGYTARAPVVFRYADQVRGEINRPVAGVPAVSVLLDEEVAYAPAGAPIEREIRIHLKGAGDAERVVQLSVRLPDGLTADSSTRTVTVPANGIVRTVAFQVRGQLVPGRHAIDVSATDGGQTWAQGYTTIDYEHISPRRMYRPSRLAIEAVDIVATGPIRVGYIQGVGDNSAAALSQLGMQVTVLDPASLPQADLRGFNAIVVGPRAYDANPALVASNALLLEYVRQGGTMVVQYGQYEMQRAGIMPYPITINRPHDRVTDEGAPVTLLDTATTVLRAPNRITTADFQGWIQDRSLYMPRTFDPQYVPALAMSDPDEAPNRGAILVARYGRGTYVYTSLAFFRQLPVGVPGAARLFVNLLSARVSEE